MDIRLRTNLIVTRNNKYLVGRIMGSRELRWSNSPYDAWKTRNADAVQTVARKSGGRLMLFNPVVGQLKPY